jgi:hypothetical protein
MHPRIGPEDPDSRAIRENEQRSSVQRNREIFTEGKRQGGHLGVKTLHIWIFFLLVKDQQSDAGEWRWLSGGGKIGLFDPDATTQKPCDLGH